MIAPPKPKLKKYGGCYAELPHELQEIIPDSLLSQYKLWPKAEKMCCEIGENVTIFTVFNREVGLSFWRNNDDYSISLNHPLSNFWTSIFDPIWKKQNEHKCPTCHGTGWDGIGYTYSCCDCGGSGIRQ